MQGETAATRASIFDYRYTTGGGQHSHVWNQTVASFQSAELNLPSFSLRPENIFHRLGQLFGYQDINFDEAPGFSRSYLLRGNDETAIRGLFRPEMLSYFESNPGLSVEANRDCLIYYRPSKRTKPEEIRGFLEEAFRVFDLFRQ
jgi:hypothetical protein